MNSPGEALTAVQTIERKSHARKVGARGILFNQRYYFVRDLNPMLHEFVEIRVESNEQTSIEVYSLDTGEHLGTGIRLEASGE